MSKSLPCAVTGLTNEKAYCIMTLQGYLHVYKHNFIELISNFIKNFLIVLSSDVYNEYCAIFCVLCTVQYTTVQYIAVQFSKVNCSTVE